MPWTCHMDETGLVTARASGEVTDLDIRSGLTQITDDPRFRSVRLCLLDYSDVTSLMISVDRVRSLAQAPLFAAESRRAFYAGENDLAYGMGRMYQAFAEHARRGVVEVFRERDAALEWLYRG